MESFKRLVFLSLFLSLVSMSSTLDMITPSQPIRDSKNETLVSANGTFEAGFFSSESSKSRYFGIWYGRISPTTVVWVANRETPLNDKSGVLKVESEGILSIVDGTGAKIWSSNASKAADKQVIVQLLESGNLIVKNGDKLEESPLWQSFDYPSDTLLPGMKIGSNLRTGQYWALTSWKTLQDPSPGEFSLRVDTRGLPQLVITKGDAVVYRPGSWNGRSLTGTPELRTDQHFVINEEQVFYEIELPNGSFLMRSRLIPQGIPIRFTWSQQTKTWEQHLPRLSSSQCASYALCGANTNCNGDTNSRGNCECLIGFKANPADSAGKFGGCVRETPLGCRKGDSFRKYEGMKLPDTSSSWYDEMISQQECEKLCLSNCSCAAYAKLNISGQGNGCLHWFHDIVDMIKLTEGGQDFYLRMSEASEQDPRLNRKQLAGIVLGCTIFIIGIIVLGSMICIQKRRLLLPGIAETIWKDKTGKDIELPTFDFSLISNATDNFSQTNKLGQGGFGPVYKGILSDGLEIAVKRLSKTSGQGLEEFKNEVMLIAKLQHRNLVKLLGCSIQHDEKLLVYEFMPNRSLDYFIFDSTRSKQLGWAKRFDIIGGIARGLLYLHQDSRLKIVHRDLKTSNILLDNNMNPKISDFGMARTFGLDQDEANTNRVMGTYGYMPPEYAVHGSFSVKSDVFSFGVIVLEIISGNKNRGFNDPNHHLNLLGHAWRLWIEDKPIELMDKLTDESATPSEILRCIHVGLLCVQQRPEDRPNMSAVVLMLNGEKLLPDPSQPGFYTGRDYPTQTDSSSIKCDEYSINEVSNSTLEAR